MSHRKTESEHRANGTFRPGRHRGVQLPVEVPPMPPDLKPAAQAAWNLLTADAKTAGLISRVDGLAMRLLCESVALYLEAQDVIAEHGIVVLEDMKDGKAKRQKTNPAVIVRAKAVAEIVTLLKKFGLTPADRRGLNPGGPPTNKPERDALAKILKMDHKP